MLRDEELAKTLIHTLEPVVGADHVRASVHVEYDLGTSEDTQESYDPKTPTALTQEHSEETSVGEAPAGVPGTASNVPSPTTPPPATPAPATPAPATPAPRCRRRRQVLSRPSPPARNIRRRNRTRPRTRSARACTAAWNPRDGCGGSRPPYWWMTRWSGPNRRASASAPGASARPTK